MIADEGSSLRRIGHQYFFRATTRDFRKIPGGIIAYWVGTNVSDTFKDPNLGSEILTEGQNKTANNERFVRFIWEVDRHAVGKGRKWLTYSKGGDYRKWFGNLQHVVDWSDNARLHYRKDSACRLISESFWYREGITWTDITSGGTGFRYLPTDTTFDMSGPTAFFESPADIYKYISLLNSCYTKYLLPVLNPTLHAQLRDIKSIPRLGRATANPRCIEISKACIRVAKGDWDSYETACDFATLPLLSNDTSPSSLKSRYRELRAHWLEKTLGMQRLEEENNRNFIAAYSLQDELEPNLPLSEITLTCNPHYRYGGDKSDEELETLLLADTMRELVSYAVGCMFGRFALDKPGLILANQGETIDDYRRQIPSPRFAADSDNAIPMLDGNWFADDITLRFRQFLRVAFGDEHYEDNLAFVEQALNVKGKRNYSLRDYFLGEFYADHVRRYKKRPIYWLFASSKGSFSALIYMHRYRPDTASVVLKYLREYRTKLAIEKERQAAVSISPGNSQGERTRAMKEVDRLTKVLAELEDYERDALYPLATEQVEIDLDDGVKVNYLKLGAALKKLPGLEAKDDD